MKKKIDLYYSENYDYLMELAASAIKARNRSYDAGDLVNYSYERALEICTYGDIADCVCNIILKDCYWTNSYINREILLKQTPFENTEDYEAKPVDTFCDEIEDKVMLEKWFNDKQAMLELYRIRIKNDRPKQIVLETMLKLRTRSARKLAEHFGIHYISAYHYVRDIVNEVREFEEEVNKYDNKNVINR